MASNILAKQSGSAYDQSDNLTPESAYGLPGAVRIAIHSRAPSWGGGPAASRITSAEIEAQRQAFLAKFGSDGLDQITN